MTPLPDPPNDSVRRVLPGDPRYFELVTFLDDEAALLDAGELLEWHGLLAPDLSYKVPVRRTMDRGQAIFDEAMCHIDDVYGTITPKLQRLARIPSAWAENPPSGSRRFVTAIRVWESIEPGEFDVQSSVLLVRSRFDDVTSQLLSGRRVDLIRRTPDGFRLARRTVYMDQATVPMANLAIYL